MKEFCNPLNLNYKYQHYGAYAHREGADPTLVWFKGRYYLFVSMSAGFYHSADLVHWDWHENRQVELYHYAPDARPIGDWLYLCASSKDMPSTIWRTRDPLSDVFEKVSAPFDFWDPALFEDEDGRVYLYWGSSNFEPIRGVEMDPGTMQPVGEKQPVLRENKNVRGWERFNYPGKRKTRLPLKDAFMHWLFFDAPNKPFMEGAYMNRWNGRYYLQYAAPATEEPVYGDGYAVGDSPLGPFTAAPNSPFSLRLGGFIQGAGHGSTLADQYGNLWHVASMCICVNQNFERRVGLFPAGLDKDGLLYCCQNFADYPMVIPEGKFDPAELRPRYMLLSYHKKATASSALPGHGADKAVDESIQSCWCAEGSSGEWLQLDLGRVYEPHAVQINFADCEVPVIKMPPEQCALPGATGGRYIDSGKDLRTRYLLEGSLDGSSWFMVADKSAADTDLPHDYLVLPEHTALRYLRLTGVQFPYGSRLAVSGLRVFGLGDGQQPAAVERVTVRMADRNRTARLSWPEVAGAMGYNVRFGIAPDKLYSSCQLYGDTSVTLTTLNGDQAYWFAVDSFNENGITPGKVLPMEKKA